MACRGVTLHAEDVSNFKGDVIVSKYSEILLHHICKYFTNCFKLFLL
jgi:hypothetical protein